MCHLVISFLAPMNYRGNLENATSILTEGVLALRNPRAHELIEDDPEKALEYIAFISLLAKSLDKASRA